MNLDELRQQRAHMAQHLAWLDRQIATLVASENQFPSASPSPVLPAPGEAAAIPVTPSQETTSGALETERLAVDRLRIQGVSRNQKLGCVLLVIGLLGAVIFTIFGLPYLIYDEPDPAVEKAP